MPQQIVPIPEEYIPWIQQAAAQFHVSPSLVAGVIMRESGFNPTASNPSGARGLGQFLPGTAQQYQVNPNDPQSSIYGVAHYLSDLIQQNGSVPAALQAYGGFTTADPTAYINEIQGYASQYGDTLGNSSDNSGLGGMLGAGISTGANAALTNIENSLATFWNEHYAAGIFLIAGVGLVSIALLGLAMQGANSPAGQAAINVAAPEVGAATRVARSASSPYNRPTRIRSITAARAIRQTE